MARKRFSDEDILKVFRQVEIDLASGNDIKTHTRCLLSKFQLVN